MNRRGASESGAATVLVLALVGVLGFVMVGLAAGVGLVRAQRVAQSAADLAALAGAGAIAAGAPACADADRVARANAARLVSCEVSKEVVLVGVSVPGPPWPGREVDVLAQARAGPG